MHSLLVFASRRRAQTHAPTYTTEVKRLAFVAWLACATANPAQVARTQLSKGRVAHQAGHVDRADQHFDAAYAATPTFAVTREHVSMLLSANKLERAVAVAQRYSDDKPADMEGLVLFGETSLRAGRLDEAMEIAKQTKEMDANFGPGRVLRARVYLAGMQPRAAIDELTPFVPTETASGEVWMLYARALSDAERHKEALSALDRALVKLAKPDAETLGRAGSVARAAGALSKADEYLARGLAIDPQNGRVHFELGILANKRGNQALSLHELAIAVRAAPNEATFWYGYGEILRLTGQAEQALTAYRQALALRPPHPKAPGKLGLVLAELGRLEEAEVLLTNKVRSEPSNPEHLLGLADVYRAAQKHKLALETYQLFLQRAAVDDPSRARVERAVVDLREPRRR